MKNPILSLLMVLMVAGTASAAVIDAPHNDSNGIACSDCHNYSLWWQFSPSNGRPEPGGRKTIVANVCLKCHYEGGAGPTVNNHSALGMGTLHNLSLPDWTRSCTDCHDPHFQKQLEWFDAGTNSPYLVLGSFTPGSLSVAGSGTAASPYFSTFAYSAIAPGPNADWDLNLSWSADPSLWSSKNGNPGRGLIVALSASSQANTYEIESVDATNGTITVRGMIVSSFNASGGTFGLLYGQLLRNSINSRNVKFFNPKLPANSGQAGGLVDTTSQQGVCQVCHSLTKNWTFDNLCRNPATGLVTTCSQSPDNHYSGTACTNCHTHGKGFGPSFSQAGKHNVHLTTLGYGCVDCHGGNSPPLLKDGQRLATTTTCGECHHDGKGGAPTKLDYKENWSNNNYVLGCFGCHKGRLASNDIGSVKCDSAQSCQSCHRGAKASTCTSSNCNSCHDGTGLISHLPAARDLQAPPVGMQSGGHERLASTKWIRMYPCYYCHNDTIDSSNNLKVGGKHLNKKVDVVIDAKWAISGQAAPYFTNQDHPPGTGEVAKSCYNTYCHSDGTTVQPVMKGYSWTGGHRGCNSCHSHDLNEGGCDSCHESRSWAPEQRWLSAMPMYPNTGAGTERANSHLRHLFTGYSCDDCHADTVVGSCLNCHGSSTPGGDMTEDQHINPASHVDKKKTVLFKNGGTYDPRPGEKTCKNTACHVGYETQWGGDLYSNITCKACHGTDGEDVDDFGKFNGTRAKISLSEWESSGHGRHAASGNYASGNPPADFPENGCWYCHDASVLHQNEERPFRLIQHDSYKKRFEKECVFCHMTATPNDNSECEGCHAQNESLAPALAAIPSQHAQNGATAICTDCHRTAMAVPSQVDHLNCTTADCHAQPPATWSNPDHRTYAASGTVGGEPYCSACHYDDATRHKTEAGTWTRDQKEDIKNSYLQMGVCLKCHDDDSGGQCESCHTGAQYSRGFNPGLPGTRMITPVKAKASSMHFGHKHYAAFTDSLNVQPESGSVSNSAATNLVLKDASKNWAIDHWYGYSVEMTSGPNAGQVRLIAANTLDTLTLATGFSVPVLANNNYRILIESGTVAAMTATTLSDSQKNWTANQWKGYSVAFTDGPNSGEAKRITANTATTLTLAVPFTQTLANGTHYRIIMPVWKGGKFCWDCHDPHGDKNINMIQTKVATRTDGVAGKPITRATVSFTDKLQAGLSYAKINPPYNGVCNVCHSAGGQHYASDHGDGHNAGRKCTECHEHRFTDSHSSGQKCDSCHANRPVPRHTGFGQPRDCTKCHNGVINNRMNIMGQFAANSHHVQGVEVSNKHCYSCHWESDKHGLINRDHHQGYNNKTFVTQPGREVDLVIWNGTARPTEFLPGVTATTFTASELAKGGASERAAAEGVTPHCLGCHSDLNNNTIPFNDCKTPRQYAWDGSSIAERYKDTAVATWGKYPAVAGAAPKDMVKALSGHGNAINNAGGFNPATGLDGTIANTRGGGYNVQCFDCHNSHGSKVSGITSSYTSFKGDQNGANLKETQAGKGGYTTTYYASANTNPTAVNTYQAGAGQCFDCHESQTAGRTPWGYQSTFGATAAIIGYNDTPHFGQGDSGVKGVYPYKATTIMGGHLKASSTVKSTPKGEINGLCTPCHDPHGVSKSLGADRAYALPMLKGTWMTSPYKEDAAPSGAASGPRGSRYLTPSPTPIPSIYTDQKTFGTDRIKETADRFAGLCLSCHPKESLTDGVNNNGPWKSTDRVHEAVRGWGDNQMHSYSCSKCHAPHNSTLPRLMVTNCLNTNHRGRVGSGGAPGDNASLQGFNSCGALKSYTASFPFGKSATQADATTTYRVNCHPTGTWPDNRWNSVTPW